MTSSPAPKLTPAQRHTFETLLAAGHDRPTMAPGLVERLTERIAAGTAAALNDWTESRLYLTKSMLFTALNCEGMLVAQREQPPSAEMIPAVAVGNVSHQAIQIAHTHPDRPVASYVSWAIEALLEDDDRFADLWRGANPARQSNWQMQMVSRVAAFLDTFPPLDESWTPKFEDPVQAKVGKLTLSARPDLVLGRPRADGRQTMLLVDFKTGGLHDGHDDEAMLYALIATLRHGVAPFRSTVLSLASGDWTDPEVTEERLVAIADKVVEGVRRQVEVLTAKREPVLTPDVWCRFCPARDTCPAYAETQTSPGDRAAA